jgi:hypothetical protein
MFDLPGDELFNGLIDFSDQLSYQLNPISLRPSSSELAILSIYPWTKLPPILWFEQPFALLSYEQDDRAEGGRKSLTSTEFNFSSWVDSISNRLCCPALIISPA